MKKTIKEIKAIFRKDPVWTFRAFVGDEIGDFEYFYLFENLKKYTLGGEPLPSNKASVLDALKDKLKEKDLKINDVIYIPLYAYIHGDIKISLSPFNDQWDSGLAGYIVFPKEKIRKYFGKKRVLKKDIEELKKRLQDAVEFFNKKYSCTEARIEIKYIKDEETILKERDSEMCIFAEDFSSDDFALELLNDFGLISKNIINQIKLEEIKFSWEIKYL